MKGNPVWLATAAVITALAVAAFITADAGDWDGPLWAVTATIWVWLTYAESRREPYGRPTDDRIYGATR